MKRSEMASGVLEVMQAIEGYMRQDPVGAAALSMAAEAFAFEHHGCSPEAISQGMALAVTPGMLDPNEADPAVLECFATWFVYMRQGLEESGFL